MTSQLIQLIPLAGLTTLAFWRPTWLKGILFALAGSDSLIVGLTWRQTFNTPAGLGTAVILIGFFVFMWACFVKVVIARRQPDVEDTEDD